jgi:hypothetical protein
MEMQQPTLESHCGSTATLIAPNGMVWAQLSEVTVDDKWIHASWTQGNVPIEIDTLLDQYNDLVNENLLGAVVQIDNLVDSCDLAVLWEDGRRIKIISIDRFEGKVDLFIRGASLLP